jgi:CheY-like chemotaxis protein
MGGELGVKSELGKGSTFRITIPGVNKVVSGGVVSGGVAPSTHNSQPTNSQTANIPHRVLVVDDSPVNRKVLTAFLKRAGIASIDQAGDGVEALATLNSAAKAGDPHDLVLSDFWMPNMNGLELVEKLRADSRFSHLPIYAVTADTEFHQDSRASLFNGILLKPMTYDKLVKVLSSMPA